MIGLTSWATINLGIGIYGASKFDGETKYFHQMNAMWSGVNLCFSVPGLIRSFGVKSLEFDAKGTLDNQFRNEKIYLFNTSLDLVYVTGGFLLKNRAKWDLKNEDRLNGFGDAVILQGSFLFAFDLLMTILHTKHRKDLYPPIRLGSTQNGIGLTYQIN